MSETQFLLTVSRLPAIPTVAHIAEKSACSALPLSPSMYYSTYRGSVDLAHLGGGPGPPKKRGRARALTLDVLDVLAVAINNRNVWDRCRQQAGGRVRTRRDWLSILQTGRVTKVEVWEGSGCAVLAVFECSSFAALAENEQRINSCAVLCCAVLQRRLPNPACLLCTPINQFPGD